MQNFTEHLGQKIEKSKSKIIETHEIMERELRENLMKSNSNLTKKIKSTNSELIRGIELAEKELLKEIKIYKARSKEELMREKKKTSKLFIAILTLQIIMILAISIPAFLEYEKQKWIIPKENRSELNGNRFIVIQKEDLKSTRDGKVYYIILKKGD